MPQILPVLLGGDANVYGMARSFYETCGVRSLAVCRRALPALACSRLCRLLCRDPAFERIPFSPPRCWVWPAHTQAEARLLISCADGYTRPCWPAMPMHCAGRTALPARHPPRWLWPINSSLPPPAAPLGLRTPQSISIPRRTLCRAAVRLAGHRQACGLACLVELPFPGQRKVYLARDAAGCRRFCPPRRSSYRGAMLLQEYIPGPDTRLGVVNAYCAADGSVPWLVQGQPLLQERTPEGIGNYAAVLVEPARQDTALLEALRGLLQAAGWRGFANFDFEIRPPRRAGAV